MIENKNLSIWILILFLSFLMPLFLMNNVKYIVFALLPIFLFASKKEVVSKLHAIDYFFICYLIFSFSSILWSSNIAFVWTPGFTYATLIAIFILVRHSLNEPSSVSILVRFLQATFLITLIQHLIALVSGIPLDTNWNSFFGKNVNHTSSYLAMLLPFLLFGNNKVHLAVKIVLCLLTVLVVFHLGARAAFLSLLLIIVIYVLKLAPPLIRKLIILGVIAFSVICGVLLFSGKLQLAGGDQARLYLLKNSLALWLMKPIIGHGLGSWPLLAFNSSLKEVSGMNSQTDFFNHVQSHNWYFKVLVEQGILGVILLFSPFIFVFRKLLKSGITEIQLAFVASVLVFFFQCVFYSTTTFSVYHFSAMNLLVFINLGVLSSSLIVSNARCSKSRILFLGLVFISFLSLLWFAFLMTANYTYISAKRSILNNDTSAAKLKLKQIYKPGIFTHHNHKTSLALFISQLSTKDDKAKYLAKALVDDENSIQVKFHLAKYHVQERHDPIMGIDFIKPILHVQPDHMLTNLLLAEACYLVKDFVNVRKALNKVWRQEYLYERKYLECYLYRSEYLFDLLDMTKEQEQTTKDELGVDYKALDQSLLKLDRDNLTYFDRPNNLEARRKLDSVGFKIDKTLVNLLDENRVKMFLRDKYLSEAEYQFKALSNRLAFSKNQLISFEKDFIDFWIDLKYMRISDVTIANNEDMLVSDFINSLSNDLTNAQKRLLKEISF